MTLVELYSSCAGLMRAKWYSSTVIAVIALDMMLVLVVFGVVDGVLFKPLPYPSAGSLYTIEPGFVNIPRGPNASPASPSDLRHWSLAAPGFRFTGYSASQRVGFGEAVNEAPYGVAEVQENFFEVIGVRPILGGLSAGDFKPSPSPPLLKPVVISYEVWRNRFERDPNVLGRTFVYDTTRGAGYRVVGVMPQGFIFPSTRASVNFITPKVLPLAWTDDPRRRTLQEVVVRAPPGTGAASIRGEIEAGMADAAAAFPSRGPKPPAISDRAWRTQGPFQRADVESLAGALSDQSRPMFRAVFAAAVILLAVGTLNVSSLMAARAFDRVREFGLRRALGAAPASIARIPLLEALILTSAGAAIGLAGTWPLLRTVLTLLPDQTVLLKVAAVDWRIVVFAALGPAVLTGVAGVWPVCSALRHRLSLLAGGRSTERDRSVGRFMAVAVQVAGTLILTIVGALFVGSLLAAYAHQVPIRTNGVIAIETMMLGPNVRMGRFPERTDRVTAMIARLRAIPGVTGVAATGAQLLRGGNWPSTFVPPRQAASPAVAVDVQSVTSSYFHILQPPLLAGR